MKHNLIFILIIFVFSLKILAQDYKDVTNQELKMSKFEKDPDADGLILFEISDMRINSNFNLEQHVFRKIKILSEAGKEYANVKIRYWYEDDINDLSATSYSPSGEKYELDDDKVITTETNRWDEKSFTIPGVVVGSVIEYEYEKKSKYIINMEPWLFQHSIYTVESDLNIILPFGFNFQTLTRGLELYNIKRSEETIRNPDDFKSKASQFTFIGKDIPGLKDEPFTDNVYDEYAKIIFMLESYKDEYQTFYLARSWNELSDYLIKFYSGFWDPDFDLNPILNGIIKSNDEPLEKAKKIYEVINSRIKTAGTEYIYSKEFKSPEILY